MNKYELNDSACAAVMEEQPVQNEQSGINPEMNDIPYEDFISVVEGEILSEEIDKYDSNVADLKNYLKVIKDKKENFLIKIGDENRRLSAEALFGIEEMVVRNLIEKIESRSEEFKIEDAKWQQEIIFYINKIKNKPEELKMFWDEYDTLFAYENDSQSGNKYKAGIMAPMALQNILQEKYGLKVAYSRPEEDVRCSVDMIATDEQNKVKFLIQVKTDKDLIKKMAGKVLNAGRDIREENSKQEKEKNFIKIVEKSEFGKSNKNTHKDYQKFSDGCSRYVARYREFFNDKSYKTIGVYIYVPYVVKGERFVGIDGAPTGKMWKALVGEGLETKLGLPKKFDYGSIPKR